MAKIKHTEFEIQAVAYCAILKMIEQRRLPLIVRGEYCLQNTRKRFDIVVLEKDFKPLLIIEVKPTTKRTERTARQCDEYCGLAHASVMLVGSMAEAQSVAENVYWYWRKNDQR